MLLKQILREPKRNVTQPVWSQERPARKDFPLSCKAGGRFPITRKWRWTVLEFDALGAHFRLMVAYHTEVPLFHMVLGQAVKNDTRVLLRVEYDVAHPNIGWHTHSVCDDVSGVAPGMIVPGGQKRIPSAGSRHRRGNYTLNDDSMNDIIALDIAAQWFRFSYQPPLGLN